MLSILIPVYNWDVRSLVQVLLSQLEEIKISFEVLVFDDCSDPIFQSSHSELDLLEGVTYVQLARNLGRSKIRNLLASKASGEYLLFLDADVLPLRPDFILYYWEKRGDAVLCGGIAYELRPPTDPSRRLRWHYGREREALSAFLREQKPYAGFKSANFFLPASLFQQFAFEEGIKTYGHEDTLFGQDLEKMGIPILHLDNPVYHLGLEPASVFLNKTTQAIEKLIDYSELKSPLQSALKRAQQFHLLGITSLLFRITRPLLERNLQSGRPSLRLFDCYKLGLGATIMIDKSK